MFLPVTMELLRGFWETVKIFFLTLAFSLPLGLVVAFGSMSRFRPLKRLTQGFVWIIRGTPLMLQLIAIFYGPGLLFDIHILGRFEAVIVAFAINYACYFSEIYRGGIESVPQGQYEAGQVLGMTKSQIFFRVTLLQVIKRKFTEGIKAKMGAALLIDKIGGLKKEFDYSEYGGAPILGIKGPIVKMHGSSSANAVKNTILKGIPYVTENVVATIEQSVLEIEENTLSED